MGSLAELRSLESRQRSPVQFVNRTRRNIEIFWLNFSGQQISYGTLDAAGRRLSAKAIDTFVSHPWIAVDCESKQRLWFDKKEVFFPPAPNLVRVAVGPNREEVRVKRSNIFITKPGKKTADCYIPSYSFICSSS